MTLEELLSPETKYGQHDVVFSNGIVRATKTIEKISQDEYMIHSFTDGWLSADLNEEQVRRYVMGEEIWVEWY